MQTYIGTPVSRVDGRAKVTGAAKYAGEFNATGLAYGVVVGSSIAKGRIARIDTRGALRVTGVLGVLTHENRPRMAGSADAYTRTTWLRRDRRSARCTTARSCSADSRSPWCWPRSGRLRGSRLRACTSNMKSKRTSPTCTRNAIGPS